MNLIKNWVSGFLGTLDDFAEGRIQRASTCPDCGHGMVLTAVEREDQAAGCPCTNPDCECADDDQE
jgi:hypothetical protein